MPDSRACRIVARESESSCGPHPKDQPPPPTAQEPNPTFVILSPVEPSGRVGNAMISPHLSDLTESGEMKQFDLRKNREFRFSSRNVEALESNDASECRGEIGKYGSKI